MIRHYLAALTQAVGFVAICYGFFLFGFAIGG